MPGSAGFKLYKVLLVKSDGKVHYNHIVAKDGSTAELKVLVKHGIDDIEDVDVSAVEELELPKYSAMRKSRLL
jgi:hypothetical protein